MGITKQRRINSRKTQELAEDQYADLAALADRRPVVNPSGGGPAHSAGGAGGSAGDNVHTGISCFLLLLLLLPHLAPVFSFFGSTGEAETLSWSRLLLSFPEARGSPAPALTLVS